MALDQGPVRPGQPFATEAGAADAHLPPGSPPGPWRLLDRLVVLAFALALVIPGALLVAGRKATQIENRAPRQLPALSAKGFLDATWPAGVDGFITDHLAVRPYAIRLRGEVYWLSGGTGNPRVIRGRDGWLFIRDELQPRCDFTGAEVGAALEKATADFTRAGIEIRFLLVPDKHSVYPEKAQGIPDFGPSCEDAGRAALQPTLDRLAGTVIDPLAALAAAKAAPGAPELYYSQDTHWTPNGAAIAIGELVRSFSPNLWTDADVVVRGTKRREMDTARLIGLRRVARTPNVLLRPEIEQKRENVQVPVEVNNARTVFRITSRGDQELLPGRTLVIYDSFFGIDTRLVAPFFAETTWVHIGDMANHPELATILGRFDRVVYERVARGFFGSDVGALLAPLLDAPG